jgi:hypothetical protein
MSDVEPGDRLSTLLEELGPEDPPPTLVRDVMARIAAERPAASVLPFTKGHVMTRKIIWGVAAAAAILFAVFSIKGFPPTGAGTEGTIGAAKRYQAPQLSEKDVTLGDASAQAFLQSDTFAKLIKDPAAIKLQSDANFVAQVKVPAIQAALTSPDLVAALSHADVLKELQNRDVIAALQDPNVAVLLKNEVSAVVGNPAITAVLATALHNEVFAHAVQNPQVLAALQNSVFVEAILDSRLNTALNSAVFRDALLANGFFTAIQSQQFNAALSQSVSAH